MTTKEHTHIYRMVKERILIHSYDHKSKVKGSATARDDLMQRKCKCGYTETYDLERKLT